MAQKMLKFVDVPMLTPEKRGVDARREDFGEIYREYAEEKAAEQSARCSQCGVPYCQTHCPLHNNIPDWLKLTAEGRLEEAYEVSQATNTFPEICGRICPQDRLCEGNCVSEQSGHGTGTSGSVVKYITDTAFEKGWVKPLRAMQELEQSVGIIGAGPGGLAAADRLRRMGFQVTVYDRYDRSGGLMVYGIPGFKLEKEIVVRRNDQLEDGGVAFALNCEIGKDVSFEELQVKHDAILIATGVYKSREVGGPGSGLPGIVKAIDFLVASNRKGFGDAVPEFDSGELNAEGKRVVVIGGGDTAMDCVRTAVRQGATSVKCLYRRARANMPGSQREVLNAEEEGVEFVWLSAPKGFTGDAAVDGVRVVKMRLGAPDVTGRQAPEEIEGSDYTEGADLVIKAAGFEPEDLPSLWGVEGLETTRWGTIKTNYKTHETAIPGVYAAGDIGRGAALGGWAIRVGREAADEPWVMGFHTADCRPGCFANWPSEDDPDWVGFVPVLGPPSAALRDHELVAAIVGHFEQILENTSEQRVWRHGGWEVGENERPMRERTARAMIRELQEAVFTRIAPVDTELVFAASAQGGLGLAPFYRPGLDRERGEEMFDLMAEGQRRAAAPSHLYRDAEAWVEALPEGALLDRDRLLEALMALPPQGLVETPARFGPDLDEVLRDAVLAPEFQLN